MIVEDRLRLGERVIQPAGRAGLQEEIFVNERLHGIESFLQIGDR
jgi:hypothetical protein